MKFGGLNLTPEVVQRAFELREQANLIEPGKLGRLMAKNSNVLMLIAKATENDPIGTFAFGIRYGFGLALAFAEEQENAERN